MNKGRNAAVTVAIACALSVPLAAGSNAARADELSDLRANQQLLQQRVDQLAQAIPSAGGGYLGGVPGAGAYPGPGGSAFAGKPSLGGSFPRSFLIPGTDTSIRVGGAITANYMYFFVGGNPNTTTASTTNFGNNGAVLSAPLDVHNAIDSKTGKVVQAGNPARSRGNSLTFFSPQQSKVNFESRTPTAWGEARTFLEFDMANGNQFAPGNNALLSTNNLIPRLRFAYATLGGLLAGQANSNFSDPDASTENINFGGNVGDPGVTRIPQVRYTVPLAPWGFPGAFSVSAEAPETDGVTAGGLIASDATSQSPALTTCSTTTSGLPAGATVSCSLVGVFNPYKAPVPDLTAAWYIPQPWGHMDFSAVLRPELQMKDGTFIDRSYVGYGVHFGGDFKPGWFGWNKDGFTFQFEYGDGIGRYLGGDVAMFSIISNYPTGATTAANAGSVIARTTVAWGGNVGYQHWWTPTLHSNISAGIQHHDITNVGNSTLGFVCAGGTTAALAGSGNCGLDKELISTEANLIWNPVPFANIGIEYFWGHRLVLSNVKGDVSGLISRFSVSF